MDKGRGGFGAKVAVGGAPGTASGGSGAGKLLFGCLALMMMAGLGLAVLLGVGFFAFRQSVVEYKDKAVEARDKLDKIQREASKMKESAEQAAQQADAMKEQAASASPEAMRAAMQRPATTETLRGYITFMTKLDGEPSVKEQRALSKKLREGGGKNGGLEGAGLAMEFTRVNQDVSLAAERLAEPLGGIEPAVYTGFQVIALASAAVAIDAANPATAKTAAAMKAAQPARKKRYEALVASRDKFLKMTGEGADAAALQALGTSEEGKQIMADQQELATWMATPGEVLLVKLTPETLDAWIALSDKDREALTGRYARMPSLPILGGFVGEELDVTKMAPLLVAVDQIGSLGLAK